MRVSLIFLMGLACSSVAHAGAARNTPAPPVTPVTRIAMYGDSTMLGTTRETGGFTVTPRNAVSQLDAMLTAAGYKVSFTNHGVNMIITDDLLNGTRGVPRSWVAEMKSSNADIVVINTGLNDAALMGTGWDDVAHVKATWTKLVKVALAQGKVVFVETPNPCTDRQTAVFVTQIAGALAEVVAENPGTHLIDQHAEITRRMPQWSSHLPDGIHPDDTLYTFKAAVEAQALIPALPSL